jgi:hypothetical protein
VYKSIYSGPERSGICICGCKWESHHLSIVFNQKRIEETKEGYALGPCLRYGNNETEGLKYNEDTDEWDFHCCGYCDSGIK